MPENPWFPLPQQQDEVMEWVEHFRSRYGVLDRCRSLSDAASFLSRDDLASYCQQIGLPADSPIFRTMRLIGDGFSAFDGNFHGERYDWAWLGVGMLALDPSDDQLERLSMAAKVAGEGEWKVAIVQLIEFRRLTDPGYEAGSALPSPETYPDKEGEKE